MGQAEERCNVQGQIEVMFFGGLIGLKTHSEGIHPLFRQIFLVLAVFLTKMADFENFDISSTTYRTNLIDPSF